MHNNLERPKSRLKQCGSSALTSYQYFASCGPHADICSYQQLCMEDNNNYAHWCQLYHMKFTIFIC